MSTITADRRLRVGSQDSSCSIALCASGWRRSKAIIRSRSGSRDRGRCRCERPVRSRPASLLEEEGEWAWAESDHSNIAFGPKRTTASVGCWLPPPCRGRAGVGGRATVHHATPIPPSPLQGEGAKPDTAHTLRVERVPTRCPLRPVHIVSLEASPFSISGNGALGLRRRRHELSLFA
jgi:hypothetical protein